MINKTKRNIDQTNIQSEATRIVEEIWSLEAIKHTSFTKTHSND